MGVRPADQADGGSWPRGEGFLVSHATTGELNSPPNNSHTQRGATFGVRIAFPRPARASCCCVT
eukprot:4127882-Pyramimonas_sp.AAC.1